LLYNTDYIYWEFENSELVKKEGHKSGDEVSVVTDYVEVLGEEGKETWYVVTGDVQTWYRITVKGDVHLILTDQLTIENGGEGCAPLS